MKFDNVLVAIDGSTLSDVAIKLALHSVGVFSAHLTFVNVVDNSDQGEFFDTSKETRVFAQKLEGETIVAKAKKMADAKGVPCETMIIEGVPWFVLSELSKKYDLIIMSVTGKGAFGSGRMGSTACKTIENSHCPILTLKSDSNKLDTILLPVETDDVPAIDVAIESTKRINGKLTVLYVKTNKEGAVCPVDSIAEKCKAAGINYDTQIAEGHPAQVICAESGKYDLVVMGTHGRQGLARALKGSVAETVMLNAACPVTVVRNN